MAADAADRRVRRSLPSSGRREAARSSWRRDARPLRAKRVAGAVFCPLATQRPGRFPSSEFGHGPPRALARNLQTLPAAESRLPREGEG
jgi:hypothetical protein